MSVLARLNPLTPLALITALGIGVSFLFAPLPTLALHLSVVTLLLAAGAGLRGYGNLIILKHNNTYLTAYAHNQSLLVKEDQSVKKGQKIAEMGSTDADRVKLHFEVRRQGKPVDPSRYLPSR